MFLVADNLNIGSIHMARSWDNGSARPNSRFTKCSSETQHLLESSMTCTCFEALLQSKLDPIWLLQALLLLLCWSYQPQQKWLGVSLISTRLVFTLDRHIFSELSTRRSTTHHMISLTPLCVAQSKWVTLCQQERRLTVPVWVNEWWSPQPANKEPFCADLSLCWLMTNYSIVFTITCQGDWVVQMVLLEPDSWPDWLCRVRWWDCVMGQKWKPVEMFTWNLHYVCQISLLDVSEQAGMTVLTSYCSPATGVEWSCWDLQVLKNC